jgi:carotenoid cleavage dioxygenase-like enzyme
VSGRLPPWLRGSLMLNGCGDYTGMEHLFDGFACMTRIRLDGAAGMVAASQRFLESDAYRWGGRIQGPPCHASVCLGTVGTNELRV